MSCERYRGWMRDATTDELRGSHGAEFEEHVRGCATCSGEFQRARMLLTAINLGVAAQVAEEPSPKLVEQVRRKIREKAAVAPSWSARWLPVAVCATVLILAATVWTLWPRNDAQHELTASSVPPSPPRAVRPAAVESTANPKTKLRQHESMVALARPARKLSARRIERQPAVPEITEVPEVIVQPEQMKAVMLFAQALNSRQIDSAKLLADLKTADQPLEIKPLVIAPLDAPKPSNGEPGDGTPDAARKLVNLQDSK